MKRFLTLILGLMVAFTMAGWCSGIAAAGAQDLETALANMKPMNLKMPIVLNAHHALTAGFRAWADQVNQITKGKIKITIYPVGSLLQAKSIYPGVRDGVAEVGEADFGYYPREFPLFSAFYLGGINFPNTVAACEAANDWVHADFKEYKDVKMLWAYSLPPSVLMGNKKIEKLEDLKGTLVRVTGFCVDTIRRLGGTPVGITMAETYDALLKGTVDLNLANPGVLGKPLNLAEVCKYVTICPGLGYIPHVIFMNLDTWNSIPPAVQAAIEKLGPAAARNEGKICEKYYDRGLQAAKEKNLQINTLGPAEMQRWYDALKSQHADWVKKKDAMGLDGQGAFDLLLKLEDKYKAQK